MTGWDKKNQNILPGCDLELKGEGLLSAFAEESLL